MGDTEVNKGSKASAKRLYIDKYAGEIIYAEEASCVGLEEYSYLLTATELERLITNIVQLELKKNGNSQNY